MLIGIPRIVSPGLLTALMEMGHGDELVIGDANFPAYSIARAAGCRVLHSAATSVLELLDAVLTLAPLDYAAGAPLLGMIGQNEQLVIHGDFRRILIRHGYESEKLELLRKADFYARARQAYAVVASSEPERFANLIIRKGVVGQ